MSEQTIADRVEIEALRADYTDAVMMHDYERLGSLFTPNGTLRMPHVPAEATGPDEIRSGVGRLQGLWEYFVQTVHPGTIEIDGDSAIGRAYLQELMHGHDGSSHLNYGTYHDRYERTLNGWKFLERVYEVRYQDSTPLGGSGPRAQTAPRPFESQRIIAARFLIPARPSTQPFIPYAR